MSPVAAVTSVLSKYATFSGRARRSEYWWFMLANAIVANVLYFVTIGPSYQKAVADQNFSNFSFGVGGIIYVLYVLAMILPGIAVAVRRLHDTDRSGGFYFMFLIPFVGPIILLVFFVQAGSVGPNRFGADPKE